MESNIDVGIWFEKPAVNRIDAASPIPRPRPRRTPASIPGNACRRTTRIAVSNFVDPKEYDPSRRPIGTILIDSSMHRVIIGISSMVNAIIPTIKDELIPM